VVYAVEGDDRAVRADAGAATERAECRRACDGNWRGARLEQHDRARGGVAVPDDDSAIVGDHWPHPAGVDWKYMDSGRCPRDTSFHQRKGSRLLVKVGDLGAVTRDGGHRQDVATAREAIESTRSAKWTSILDRGSI